MRKKPVVVKRERVKRGAINSDTFYYEMGSRTGFTKQEIVTFMTAFKALFVKELLNEGEITVPILGVKLRIVDTPPRPERMGINPHTGERIKIAAKPAGKKIRARVIKKLKDELL